MVTCKKCHKAIKSDTADEFCKCCYPEPKEVSNRTVIGMIGSIESLHKKIDDEMVKNHIAIINKAITND